MRRSICRLYLRASPTDVLGKIAAAISCPHRVFNWRLAMTGLAWILLVACAGCNRQSPPARTPAWRIDVELLRSIDFDNPTLDDVPALVALFDAHPPEIVRDAQGALARIGEPAIPALIQRLRVEESYIVQNRASDALQRLGRCAAPALLDVFNDAAYGQPYVASVLASIRPPTDEIIAALIFALREEQCRRPVLSSINVSFYHEAKPLERALLRLLDDRDPVVRSQARDLLDALNYEWIAAVDARVDNSEVELQECASLTTAPRGAEDALSRQQAWSERLGQPREIVNSIGMRMVLIPPGEFLMGSPLSEVGRDEDEHPRRHVRITRPYYIGVYEVTQAEYKQVMGSNPSWFSKGGRFEAEVTQMDTDRFPVEGVTWSDATEFCRRLSSFAHEEAAGRVYRLPTEAEWEYACRAGTSTPFHFGKLLTGEEANVHGRFPYGTSEEGIYLGRPAPIGSYPGNAFGVHDMHGNVWEWCSDWYSSTYYSSSPLSDPPGAPRGVRRVIRGGGWDSLSRYCRSAYRRSFAPNFRSYDVGFRVAFSAADLSQ